MVKEPIGPTVKSRPPANFLARRRKLKWVRFLRSKEFALMRQYLAPRLPMAAFLSLLSALQTALMAVRLVLMLAFIQMLIEGNYTAGARFKLLGFQFQLPLQRWFTSPYGGLIVLFLLFLATLLLGAALNFGVQHHTKRLQYQLMRHLREDLLAKLMRVNMAYLTDTRMGEIAFVQGTCSVRFAVLLSLARRLMVTVMNLAMTTLILFKMSLVLTGMLLVSGGVFARLVGLLRKRAARLSKEHAAQSQLVGSLFLEILYGLRLIKIAGREHDEKRKFMNAFRGQEELAIRVQDYQSLTDAAAKAGGALLLVAFAAGVATLTRMDLFGNLAFTLGYFYIASRVIGFAGEYAQARVQFATLLPYIERIHRFLFDASIEDPQVRTPGRRHFPGIRDRVEIRDLSFRYDRDVEVLEDVNLEFPRGTVTALVGLSGAGKTTLLEILARFRLPTQGQVLVDGTDLLEYSLDSYRRRVGYVAQDMVIFNDTVLENIRYLRPDAGRDEVETAARLALAHEFIEKMHRGYQTRIGERGLKISGGQRQRIAIARLFLQNPDLILMDEATNALDLYTEAQIYENLLRTKEDKVIIVAAHRLSAITRFDRIVVLHEGRVVEQGTHSELMAAGGLYYHLYKIQEFAPEMELADLTRLGLKP